MNKYYSQEYLAIKINHLRNELSKIPQFTITNRRGKKVYRYTVTSNGIKKRIERIIKDDKLQKLLELEELRQKIKLSIRQHSAFLSATTNLNCYNMDFAIPNILPITIKDSLKPDCNPKPKKYDYWYGNIQMRSRLELLVALVLGSMGLEFYYEPELIVNGMTIYPDFVVFLPELGCCFIIECVGMMDDMKYKNNFASRLIGYFSDEIYLNEKLLLFFGTETEIPSPEHIMIDIATLINKIVLEQISHTTSREAIPDEFASVFPAPVTVRHVNSSGVPSVPYL